MKRLCEERVVSRAIARREDCEDNYGKVCRACCDLLSINLRNVVARIFESTTTKCTKYNMSDLVST